MLELLQKFSKHPLASAMLKNQAGISNISAEGRDTTEILNKILAVADRFEVVKLTAMQNGNMIGCLLISERKAK